MKIAILFPTVSGARLPEGFVFAALEVQKPLNGIPSPGPKP